MPGREPRQKIAQRRCYYASTAGLGLVRDKYHVEAVNLRLQPVQELDFRVPIERRIADEVDSRQVLLAAGRVDQLRVGESLHRRYRNELIAGDTARRQGAAQLVTVAAVADG